MKLAVDKKLKTPVYLQIVSQIKKRIVSGELAPGYALPSERALAKSLGVHRNTVVRAYTELKADGLITSYQGVGYRVQYRAEEDRKTKKAVNWASQIKAEYMELESAFDDLFIKAQTGSKISFAAGMAAGEVYGQDEVADCLAKIMAAGNRPSYFYTPYQGDLELRREIAAFMRTKGVLTSPGQIQIFSENNQALDFLVTLLLSPGDKIFTEESTSPDVYRAIELAGGEIIPVPMDEEGMVCDHLGPLIEQHRPKFIYVNCSYHNPTGIVLSMERRKKLLDLSYQYRIPIVEEDEASELYFEGNKMPSLKSMDPGENVIYMYSFSLTLVPGVGVSFMIAPKEVVKSLSNLVSVRLVTLDWTPQHLACQYLKDGTFLKKLEDFRKNYRRKRDLMCDCLDKIKEQIPLTYQKPRGGVYLWVKLPADMDVARLTEETERRGVSFIPGAIFFPGNDPDANYIRLNYSYPTEEQIKKGMKILTESMQKIQKNSGFQPPEP
ncbi:PLP-dependent aminotransferase family protein [Anaerovorax odorimutans]|uniref:PLP-dependent aminotransferase family protein n=1 Tax=Anaerovorax odorimutans TaxID=109327 RepID=A0ABT1RSH0_9FIRM|nr:PLP-dependent aminotransferase family protein [Anaerovorax odorimutans]MCQ4638165.1 PLP-dependent aminotransferase family protein [Anaerovorax odorimutans]